MNSEIATCAVIGGVIPDALRVLKWARTAKGSRGVNPLKDSALYVALAIQVALALFAAWILALTTPLQAAAVGYAAPDVIVRVLSNIGRSAGKNLAGTNVSLGARLREWFLS